MQTTRYRRPGLVVREHVLPVPLDHAHPEGERIDLFARELVDSDREHDDLPWLLWLQGGPGNRAERPGQVSGWLARALREFRVVLMDQRGTGRSTPATRQTLPGRGDAKAQAAYLTHFRADSIVRDGEVIRRTLAGDDARWTLVGQSFGGFCVLSYLSFAPEGVREAIVTGGLPPLEGGPDPVYRSTYEQVARRNAEYFARYPDDQRRARDVARHLAGTQELLPTGEVLTARRFQTAGNSLGNATRFDAFHDLLEDPFVTSRGTRVLSDTFLQAVWAAVSFADRPLYALLHEPCWCQGEAANWSAERIRAERGDEFDAATEPFRFTGEMVYPWQYDEDPALVSLRDTAYLLAEKDDWPALYDVDRLAANEVPVAAAVYVDDMYVPFDLSLPTARHIGGLNPWITNTHQHDGIRQDGAAVLDRMLDLVRGR